MSNRSISDLNDAFRRGQSDVPGKVVITQGIAALGHETVQAIMQKVQGFNDFSPGNDPYGEHDFGMIVHEETSIYFKIDYFDPSLQFHSEDKKDLTKTVRVMTVMLASEY